MLIETLTGKTFTPEDACRWSVEHGYKALNQGTYYSYFTPQFKAFGLDCQQLSWTSTYGKPAHSNHQKALDLLKEGYYLIACMGKGLWTSSGHFVVVWWADDKIRINDPASTKAERWNGDPYTFRSQVKYYWAVDARAYNTEDDTVTQEQFDAMMENYLERRNAQPADKWAVPHIQAAIDAGLMSDVGGTIAAPLGFVTRQELAVVAVNAAKK